MASIYQDTIDKYSAILEEDSHNIRALLILARIAIKEGRVQEGVDYYTKIFDIDSDHPEALYMIGFISMINKDNDKAKEKFLRLIRINKANPFIYEYMSFLDFSSRTKYLELAIEINEKLSIRKKDYGRYSYIAFKAYLWGEYKLALRYAELAYNANATNTISNLLGCIYYKLEDYDNALSYFYSVSLDLKNSNLFTLSNISSCFKQKKSINLAVRYLNKALDVNDTNKFVYYSLGYIYANILEEKDLALKNLNRALEIDSNYMQAMHAKLLLN